MQQKSRSQWWNISNKQESTKKEIFYLTDVLGLYKQWEASEVLKARNTNWLVFWCQCGELI